MKCGAIYVNGTHLRTVHGHGHRTENMLDARANLGFPAVILFLLPGQGLVAVYYWFENSNTINDKLYQTQYRSAYTYPSIYYTT